MTEKAMGTRIFALGSNGSGQLAIGHKEDVSVPKLVLFHDMPDDAPAPAIKALAAGGNHTLALSADGRLFCVGDSATGSCGRVTGAPDHRFRKVEALPGRVTKAAATWGASIVLVESSSTGNQLCAFGLGQKGELGLGPLVVRTPNPTRIENFWPEGSHIADLVACVGHVVAVLDNGEVWGWGNGRKGQLGELDGVSAGGVVNAPRRITGVAFPVRRAVCGREFTCLFGDPAKGDFTVLGSDKWGARSKAPSGSMICGWVDVVASWGSIHVLMGDGRVMSWGRNDHGQLAPKDMPRIKQIAAGSEHVVALNDEGHVTAWGWGEHGNCGPRSKSDVAKATRNIVASVKYMPQGSAITALGAGCATSWIVIEIPT